MIYYIYFSYLFLFFARPSYSSILDILSSRNLTSNYHVQSFFDQQNYNNLFHEFKGIYHGQIIDFSKDCFEAYNMNFYSWLFDKPTCPPHPKCNTRVLHMFTSSIFVCIPVVVISSSALTAYDILDVNSSTIASKHYPYTMSYPFSAPTDSFTNGIRDIANTTLYFKLFGEYVLLNNTNTNHIFSKSCLGNFVYTKTDDTILSDNLNMYLQDQYLILTYLPMQCDELKFLPFTFSFHYPLLTPYFENFIINSQKYINFVKGILKTYDAFNSSVIFSKSFLSADLYLNVLNQRTLIYSEFTPYSSKFLSLQQVKFSFSDPVSFIEMKLLSLFNYVLDDLELLLEQFGLLLFRVFNLVLTKLIYLLTYYSHLFVEDEYFLYILLIIVFYIITYFYVRSHLIMLLIFILLFMLFTYFISHSSYIIDDGISNAFDVLYSQLINYNTSTLLIRPVINCTTTVLNSTCQNLTIYKNQTVFVDRNITLYYNNTVYIDRNITSYVDRNLTVFVDRNITYIINNTVTVNITQIQPIYYYGSSQLNGAYYKYTTPVIDVALVSSKGGYQWKIYDIYQVQKACTTTTGYIPYTTCVQIIDLTTLRILAQSGKIDNTFCFGDFCPIVSLETQRVRNIDGSLGGYTSTCNLNDIYYPPYVFSTQIITITIFLNANSPVELCSVLNEFKQLQYIKGKFTVYIKIMDWACKTVGVTVTYQICNSIMFNNIVYDLYPKIDLLVFGVLKTWSWWSTDYLSLHAIYPISYQKIWGFYGFSMYYSGQLPSCDTNPYVVINVYPTSLNKVMEYFVGMITDLSLVYRGETLDGPICYDVISFTDAPEYFYFGGKLYYFIYNNIYLY